MMKNKQNFTFLCFKVYSPVGCLRVRKAKMQRTKMEDLVLHFSKRNKYCKSHVSFSSKIASEKMSTLVTTRLTRVTVRGYQVV